MQGSDGGMTVPGLRVEPVTNGGDVAVLIGRGKVGPEMHGMHGKPIMASPGAADNDTVAAVILPPDP